MAPIRLPNILIYLSGVIRPKLLRPHLRVPSIAHVDFQALKKEGYNAVIIDKDNCLTIPNKDDLYPPYQTAWNDLLETFHPGRILIVSNSAGTRKDPGGIAAESVSLSLRAPILIHSQNKPGCSSDIISYFQGNLGIPMTNRKKLVIESEKIELEEKKDELMLWERWSNEIISKPLLGYNELNDHERNDRKGDKVFVERYSPKNEIIENKLIEKNKKKWRSFLTDDLKVLVIGDRLFTDTLLAHRLSLHLPLPKPLSKTTLTSNNPSQDQHTNTNPHLPSVLSIYTTSLPQPKDVRILRWIEERLSQGKTKSGDYSRFILREKEENETPSTSRIQSRRCNGVLEALRWLTPLRWKEFDKSLPPLSLNPRSWKPLPVFVGTTKSIALGIALLTRYTIRGGNYSWVKFRDWYKSQPAIALGSDESKTLKAEAALSLLEQSQSQSINSGAKVIKQA